MTREEHKKYYNVYHPLDIDVDDVINKVFDYFKNRTCESCKHYQQYWDGAYERSESICLCQDSNCCGNFVNRDFCCNRYEPKEIK